MINLSYNDFYEKMSQSVNEFNLVDNFSFNKRNLLVTNAETINEYFKKEGISSEQIYRLEKLQQKMIQRAEGGVVSNLFLKFLGNGEGLKELRDRSLQIAHEIKKINKLLKGANNTNFLPSFLSVEGKKLDKLLFDDHIYERMIHFGHTFKLNEDGVVVFKFSERTSLDDEVVESSIDEIEDPDTYWEELHEEFLEKGFVLEVRGEFENGLYREISASEITSAQLKEIIVQEDGSFNQDIHVIYPTQNLTVEELEERCVLDKDEETGEYLINSEYQYLQDGFRDYPYERWDHLRPYGHTLNKPKDFLIDIIVHSRPDLPGVFIDQGHVSVKMTTPNGEVYSLGFYPEDSERHPYDLRMQKGDLVILKSE